MKLNWKKYRLLITEKKQSIVGQPGSESEKTEDG